MYTFFVTLILLLSAIFVLYYVIVRYLRRNFDYWKKRKVCGPKPHSIFYGTFPKSGAGVCNFAEELHELYLQYKSSTKYIGVFRSTTPKLFILDPLLAKQILTTQFKDFRDNESSEWSTPSVDPLRTQSPFVSVGDAWKEKRSELVPVLTASRIRAFHPCLQESANKLLNYIKRHLKEPLDGRELINRYTADLLSTFIWDIQTHTDAFTDGSFSDVHKMGNKMIEQALESVRYYGRTALFPWIARIFPVRFFPKVSDDFFLKLGRYALKMRASNAVDQGNVINHLLQLRDKKSLNEIQIAGHTTTILIDGFETGAIVSAHLLLLLARYPRVQQKLREELYGVDEKCSYDVLNNLECLDQCIKETLRIFPPLTLLFKICTEEVSLENSDGTRLQLVPGTTVYISSYSFQRDADNYEQPETFWPERFDAELGGVRKYQEMGVYLPFGDGPRICPGMKLGIAEVKMAVASIVRNFSIKPSPRTRSDNKVAANTFLLALDGGIELVFEEL